MIYGGAGGDTIYGANGNDQIRGDAGADVMLGGYGDDFYYMENVGDQAIESSSAGYDTVYTSATATLAANVESIYLSGSANANVTGNALGNQISGNSFVNVIRGLAGADTISSGNGADTVIGGTGNDVFRFLTVVGSTPSARDVYQAGDGAVAFERPGAKLGDRIDVSAIDANQLAGGFQHFTFGASTGVGRLWATNSGNVTIIHGNIDGDAAAEFEIAIQDGSVLASAYSSADFIA